MQTYSTCDRYLLRRWPRVLGAVLALLVSASGGETVRGQAVCIPLPRLLTTMPMGGQQGSQLEVTIGGDHLDDADQLLFTHPGITAKAARDSAGNIQSGKFTVTIAPDCPVGLHEARVLSRLGISSARIFSVDRLPETVRSTPNTSLATAMELSVGSICNAFVSSKAVDHYRFSAAKAQRIAVHCAARGIDSKLDAVLVVADEAGRDLVVERRGGVIDFAVPADGRYVIKIHDLTFNGGPAYFYRLSLREVKNEEPVPVPVATQSVSAFSWPPPGLAANAATVEVEPNDSAESAQKIALPCDVSGTFHPAADIDRFQFSAQKGDVWWVEVASQRLGRPTDPAIVVQAIGGDGASQSTTDLVELSDIASPVKVSSNGYAYDGPPFNAGSTDVLGKIEIKQDGIYQLQLSDLFGGTRKDPNNVYRLVVRRAEPDFALVAWGLHMELRNGDRAALSKPLALRAGQTMALEVVAVRRDGFDGAIELAMEGLPPGVTAQGVTIPAGKTRGIMLVSAHAEAPTGLAFASFVGRGVIDGQTVTRPCRLAEMAWPVPDSWGEIPVPRLVSTVAISVTTAEAAPMSIAALEPKTVSIKAGQKVTIPLKLTRRTEFSGTVLQLRTLGDMFDRTPQFNVPITADASEAVLDTAALKVPPGRYTIAFYGPAVAKYQDNPGAVAIAQAVQQRSDAEQAAAQAEVKRLSDALATASTESKAELEKQLGAAKAAQQAAEQRAKASAQQVKAASDRAAPKDTVDIVVSEPITLDVTN